MQNLLLTVPLHRLTSLTLCLAASLGLAACSAAEPSQDDTNDVSGGDTHSTTVGQANTSGGMATTGQATSGGGGDGGVGPTTAGGGNPTTTGSSGGNPTSGNGTGGGSSGGTGGDATVGGTGNSIGGNGGSGAGGGSSSGGASSSTATSTTGPHVVGETGTETIPGSGCTPPGAYANLFIALSGHSQEESDAKIEAAWNQLYNPSNGNTVYYDGPGADESYVKDTGNNDVRSEGMSYGMMTAVQLDKQNEFDRLWTWVNNHMKNGTNEISWQCSTSGQKMSNGGAPDGEEYMATALIFAHNRWGSDGKYDYASEAQWVLDLIRTKYFHTDPHLVKFVSSSNNTDPSYILPAFYQVWACFDADNSDFWNTAITHGREYFHVGVDGNGVCPYQSSFDGSNRQAANSDSIRCVMNIMMDHNFFAADPWQTETYAPMFAAHERNGGNHCDALLGFGLPESDGKGFVDRIWSAQIPSGQWRYYDGTLYMLSLLHVSGTFKLYY